MYFPQYTDTTKSRDMMTAFGGYNEKISCADGEWSEMTNMTSDYFPVMSPRGKRGYTTHYGQTLKTVYANGGENYPVSLYERDGLTALVSYIGITGASDRTSIHDKDVYGYGADGRVSTINTFSLSSEYYESGKRYDVVKMGVRDVFIGANTAFNREKRAVEYIYREREYSIASIGIANESQAILYDATASYSIDSANESVAAGEKGAYGEYDGQYRLFTETDGMVYGKWSESQKKWTKVQELYAYFELSTGNKEKKEYIKSHVGSELKLVIEDAANEIVNREVYFPDDEGNGRYSVTTPCVYFEDEKKNEFGLLVKARESISNWYSINSKPVTIMFERKDQLYGTECNNRIWSCSADGHEIYASALGEWNLMCRYAGVSTDSYAVTIGSDGEFTGAVTYNGNPIFFKERSMIKVSVSSTGAHQVKEIPCPGVQKGSRYSLVVINNILYYKGVEGIYAYDGSMPVLVSPNLTKRYFNAEAGVLLDKYYISMADNEGTYHMFVYDTSKGLWMREDNTHATCFCNAENDLFFIEMPQREIRSVRGTVLPDGTGKPYVYSMYGTDNNDWEVTSGVVGFASPDHKYIGKLSVRLSLELGANVDFYIEYDSDSVWEHKFSVSGRGTRSYTIPVIPHRCDHFRYKIVGRGDCKIFSISKTIEEGSDV